MNNSPIDSPSQRAVIFLSVGLLQQSQQIQRGQVAPVTLLNDNIRRGWEQYCYLCFSKGLRPPSTLPELVLLLHRPLDEWTALDISQLGSKDALLEDGSPSQACEDYGADLINVRFLDLEFEDQYFMALFDTCKRTNDRGGYSRAREFLVRNSILEDPIAALVANEVWSDELRGPLKACYEKVPQRLCARNGMVLLCPHCGWTLEWRSNEAHCHPDGICKDLWGDLGESEIAIPYTPMLMRTKAGIQRYVSAIEKALIEVYDQLKGQWGIQCTLYPEFDNYDLLLEFTSGQRWAVDFKDYRRAKSLAQALNGRAYSYWPEWDKAFYVFPNYRAKREFLNEFHNFWIPPKDVKAMAANTFVARAKEWL